MGTDAQDSSYDLDWNKSICSTLTSSDVREVKKLRKLVLLSLQLDGSDKTAKKSFKRAVKQLEDDGTLTLAADGTIKMKEKKKRKSEKKEKSKKKKKRKTDSEGNDALDRDEESDDKGNYQESVDQDQVVDGGANDGSKNNPCVGNPQGVTRLFLGNLPFTVDESSLGAFLPGEVTHIKWITDKETGKFYGSAFIEIDNSKSAAEAVALAGSKLIGRPIKINFAAAREGDVWPPVKKVVSGGGQAGGSGIKAMSAKPENCIKLFIGNLSYDIDDEGIIKFFANVDAEVKAVRWLHHKDTGDFKGWYVSSIE
jgi:nucleolin